MKRGVLFTHDKELAMIKQKLLIVRETGANDFEQRCECKITSQINYGWRYVRTDMIAGNLNYIAIILFEKDDQKEE